MSGGVDSAVAALLLRRAGFDVFGIYMHNWDAGDEAGGSGAGACTSERDLQDANAVAKKLRLPLLEADFVGRYWQDVFSGFLAGVAAGVTPNPDISCNAAIKFGALWEFATRQGADVLATGHYARLGRPAASGACAGSSGGDGSGGCGAAVEPLGGMEAWAAGAGAAAPPLLLRGADASKDQSYFLAGVSGAQLAHAMFPLGERAGAWAAVPGQRDDRLYKWSHQPEASGLADFIL
jgi:tRNA-specific 2-thiouridylase